MATAEHLEATKLALQKEIEQVRADLTARIEENRLSIERVRAHLSVEIEKVRGEIARTHASTLWWMIGILRIAEAGVIVALIKILP